MNKPYPPPLPRIGNGPEQQPTAKVDATAVLHQRLDKLTELIEGHFQRVEQRLSEQDADYALMRGEVQSHGQQLLEIRVQLGRHSEGVRGASKTNLDQDAALAKLTTKVDTIEEKIDGYHKAVTGVLNNPKVRAFAKLVFTLAMTYAAAKGIKVLP